MAGLAASLIKVGRGGTSADPLARNRMRAYPIVSGDGRAGYSTHENYGHPAVIINILTTTHRHTTRNQSKFFRFLSACGCTSTPQPAGTTRGPSTHTHARVARSLSLDLSFSLSLSLSLSRSTLVKCACLSLSHRFGQWFANFQCYLLSLSFSYTRTHTRARERHTVSDERVYIYIYISA